MECNWTTYVHVVVETVMCSSVIVLRSAVSLWAPYSLSTWLIVLWSAVRSWAQHSLSTLLIVLWSPIRSWAQHILSTWLIVLWSPIRSLAPHSLSTSPTVLSAIRSWAPYSLSTSPTSVNGHEVLSRWCSTRLWLTPGRLVVVTDPVSVILVPSHY
jgi:hypothetical protein